MEALYSLEAYSVLHVGKYIDSKKWILLIVTSGSSPEKEYKLEGNVLSTSTFFKEEKANIVFETPKEQLEIKYTSCTELSMLLYIVRNASLPEDKRKISGSHIIYRTLIKKPTPLKRTMKSECKTCLYSKTVSLKVHLWEFDHRILKLQTLQELDLSYGFLEELPPELGNMSLTSLNLDGNNLRRSNFMFLEQPAIRKSLVELSLSQTNLTELPLALVNFGKLRRLDVSNNHLNSIPNKLGNLPSLMELNISWNKIDSLPFSFAIVRIKQISPPSNESLEENERSDVSLKGIYCPMRAIKYMNRFPTLKDLATVAVSSSSWSAELTLANLPRSLLNDIRNTSECTCFRTTMPYPHLAIFRPLREIIQSDDFDEYPCNMRSVYHRCFVDHDSIYPVRQRVIYEGMQWRLMPPILVII